MAQRREESNLLLDKLITLKGNTLFSFSFDYTYWDEMVEFVNTGDPSWAYENIDIALPTYNVNGVWIFRPDYSLVYSIQQGDDSPSPALPAPIEAMPQIFAHHRLVHFFVNTPQGLMEIRGHIHPHRRQSCHSPAGYFLAGRLWDQVELDDLSDLVGGTVTLVRPEENKAPEETDSDDTITLYRPLNSWDGRSLTQLRIDIPSPLTQLAIQTFNRDLNVYTTFVVLLSVIIFVLLTSGLLYP
jgi:hypothetical protein